MRERPDEVDYSKLRAPARPVLAWLIAGARDALARGVAPDRVALGFFGEPVTELRSSPFGRVVHRRAAARPEFKPVLKLWAEP